MEWLSDPSTGTWLRERLDDDSPTMHTVVPRGYHAYARIFHPASVRSLPGSRVPSPAEWEKTTDAERQRMLDAFVDAPASWSETATAFGTTLHPLAQWQRIVRTPADEDWHERISPDGREFSAPEEGRLSAELVAAVAAHLVAHTSTPDAATAALWEGWGDLVGHFGHGPSRTFLTFSDDPNHRAMLDRSVHDPLNNAFRKPTWQEGILSREISEGPRLSLPDREHILFTASARDFADPDWALRVPWRDVAAAEAGMPPYTQSPSILWPDDRAWVLVSEIDYDSTIVAGSPELVRALCADERLEALPLREDADLHWDADDINR